MSLLHRLAPRTAQHAGSRSHETHEDRRGDIGLRTVLVPLVLFYFCLHPLPAPPFTNELFSVIACSFKRRIYELSFLSNLPVPEEKKNNSDDKEQRETTGRIRWIAQL